MKIINELLCSKRDTLEKKFNSLVKINKLNKNFEF